MYSEGSRKGTGRCQTAMMCDWRREKDDHDFSKNKEILFQMVSIPRENGK